LNLIAVPSAQKNFSPLDVEAQVPLKRAQDFANAPSGSPTGPERGGLGAAESVTNRDDTPIPASVVDFLDKHISTVWALELLLLMRQNPSRIWTVADLAKELRASAPVITRVVPPLMAAEIVVEAEGGWRYAPQPGDLDDTIERLENLYKQLPVRIIRHIALAPHREAQSFADAFKFRKE
jgi:hypothetical protein